MKTQKVGFLSHAYVVFCVLFGLGLVAVDVVNAADVDVSVNEQDGVVFTTEQVERYFSGNVISSGFNAATAGIGGLNIGMGVQMVQGKDLGGSVFDKKPTKGDKAFGGVLIGAGALTAVGGIAGGIYSALRAHRSSARRAIVNDVNFPVELKGQDPNIQTAKAWLVAAYLWDKQAYVLAEDIEKKVKKQKQNSAEEVRAQILSDNKAAIASAIEEIYKPFLLLKKDQQIAVVHALLEGNSYDRVSKKIENFLEANAKESSTV